MLEVGDNARQVPDAVTVQISEAAWIDLIDDRTLPPGGRKRRIRRYRHILNIHGDFAEEVQTR